MVGDRCQLDWELGGVNSLPCPRPMETERGLSHLGPDKPKNKLRPGTGTPTQAEPLTRKPPPPHPPPPHPPPHPTPACPPFCGSYQGPGQLLASSEASGAFLGRVAMILVRIPLFFIKPSSPKCLFFKWQFYRENTRISFLHCNGYSS